MPSATALKRPLGWSCPSATTIEFSAWSRGPRGVVGQGGGRGRERENHRARAGQDRVCGVWDRQHLPRHSWTTCAPNTGARAWGSGPALTREQPWRPLRVLDVQGEAGRQVLDGVLPLPRLAEETQHVLGLTHQAQQGLELRQLAG